MPTSSTATNGTSNQRQKHPHAPAGVSSRINVGQTERWASAVGGGLLALYGLKRASLGGLLLAAAGGGLLYRGVTGHCPALEQMGMSTAEDGKASEAVRIEEAVVTNKSREEAYAFWRDVENLPRFMHHLDAVRRTDERHSHWSAPVPGGFGTVEWDAEVTDDAPNERLSWQSLPGADIHNAGTVRFRELPAGRGTEVHVTLEYRLPAGQAGRGVARLLNPAFSQMIKQDVRRFRSLMEAGEVPTTEGQPTGR